MMGGPGGGGKGAEASGAGTIGSLSAAAIYLQFVTLYSSQNTLMIVVSDRHSKAEGKERSRAYLVAEAFDHFASDSAWMGIPFRRSNMKRCYLCICVSTFVFCYAPCSTSSVPKISSPVVTCSTARHLRPDHRSPAHQTGAHKGSRDLRRCGPTSNATTKQGPLQIENLRRTLLAGTHEQRCKG